MNINRFLSLFALLALLGTGAVACDNGEEETDDQVTTENVEETTDMEDSGEAVAEAAQPEIVDGVQVITVKVEDMGYTPDRIAFKAGVPAKIIFDQHGTTECAWDVMSKDLGIKLTALPEGEQTAVEFTPEEAGTYTFTCGMDMLKGTVIVEA